MSALYVVATAGHVDHGKSTLVRTLTGIEPDRWEEERRRGLTIDLGFAWSQLPSGRSAAFVDVPGHERFVGNMLAGVGPAPAVLFVVAADEGWMPQSAEHLAALAALGVRKGVLAVTRSDLADPAPALGRAADELAGTSLAGIECRAVSSASGAGMPELLHALDDALAASPTPDPEAPVRFWIDRVFAVRGAGTVVTGTLAAGSVCVGDRLALVPSGDRVKVRGLQCLGERVDRVTGVSRVAVNVRGVERDMVRRGMALTTSGAWRVTDVIDVRLRDESTSSWDLPRELTLHIGTAATQAVVRPLSANALRLTLSGRLPLHLGDSAVLRNPGTRAIAGGVIVLDVDPPGLTRRRAAAARAAALAGKPDLPEATSELAQRSPIRRTDLLSIGCRVPEAVTVDDWLIAPEHWQRWRRQLVETVGAYAKEHPLDPRMPAGVACRALGLPAHRMLERLATEAASDGLVAADGWLSVGDAAPDLPWHTRSALTRLSAELAQRPFDAPTVAQLMEWGLDRKALAAAVRSGQLLRITDGIFLLPDAPVRAMHALCVIEQPFTVAHARSALYTTRRVAVPLLEWLDSHGMTVRVGNVYRYVREMAPQWER